MVGGTITGGLVKTGAGTLHLSGAAKLFSGGLIINGGVVSVANGDSLLGAAANPVTIHDGGIFRFTESLTTSRPFNIDGTAGIDLGGFTNSIPAAPTFAASNQLTGSATSRLNITRTYANFSRISINDAQPGFLGSIDIGSPGLVGSFYAPRVFVGTAPMSLALGGSNGSWPRQTQSPFQMELNFI